MKYEEVQKNLRAKILELSYELDITKSKKREEIINREMATLIKAQVAVDKQIDAQVNISLKGTTDWNTKCHCPACRSDVFNDKYCRNCGQKLKGAGVDGK